LKWRLRDGVHGIHPAIFSFEKKNIVEAFPNDSFLFLGFFFLKKKTLKMTLQQFRNNEMSI